MILLISSHSFEGVDSFNWFEELPQISDYDIIILDTPRIFSFWSLAGRLEHLGGNEYSLPEIDETAKKIKSNLLLIRGKLVEMLEFDVTVYALYSPDIRIGTKVDSSLFVSDFPTTYTRQPPFEAYPRPKWYLSEFINTNAWCPISIKAVVQEGKVICMKDKSYEEYFKNFKGWQYYFVPDSLGIDELESNYESRWKVTIELSPIATNKVNKPIALELIPLFHKWASGWEADEGGWSFLPEKIGGHLVLLPVYDPYDTRSLIEVLLRQIKVFEKTSPPPWVSAIEIPGEASLRNEIATEKLSLEVIESKINGLEDSLDELQKYKELLYETGLTLQNRVESTLEGLGASIEPSPASDEFIISVGGKKAVIEVKGVEDKIRKRHLDQLVSDRDECSKLTSQDIKGILIGNAWRFFPLEQRGMPKKPIFTNSVVQRARNQDIGLISTVQLFNAVCKAQKESQCKEEILNKIINGTGVIQF